MMTKEEVLIAIERFCTRTGMAETTFGRKSVNDGKFVSRLRNGGRMWPETADRVISFINEPEELAS